MKYTLVVASLISVAFAGLEDAVHATTLDVTNFDKSIASQSSGSLVAFFAPWCGHCKNLEGAWNAVGELHEGSGRCQVAKVDCDTSKNKPLAAKYDVKGFPTIKWITPDGKAEDYNGARSEAALTAFMDEKCTVDETAGRIPALDQLASKYFAPLATAEKREALLGAAKSLVAAKSEGLAEYYVKIMSKFLEGAEEAQNWIAKESERLGTLAAKKGTVTMKKLEELKMKQNILKAFDYVKSDVVEPVVESAEAVVEKIKEIKEEL